MNPIWNPPFQDPSITRVIQISIRIPNLSKEPVHILRSQHIAQIRRVLVPLQIQDLSVKSPSVSTLLSHNISQGSSHAATVSIDPDGQLKTNGDKNFLHVSYLYQLCLVMMYYIGFLHLNILLNLISPRAFTRLAQQSHQFLILLR